jgi:farnesyl diphosphate synthase
MEQFKCVYPYLRDQILHDFATTNELGNEAIQWLRDMMDYNVPGGKLNRGVMVVEVVRRLIAPSQWNTHTLARACVLGWTIEFLQAFFLVADDVMDESQTRRGQPCWYQQPHVKWIAVNDAFLLESMVLHVLKRHFGHEPYYAQLLETMLDVIQKTECGQLLDLTSQPQDKDGMDLDRFTMTRYQQIVRYKTAFYSFYLPIALGLHLAGVTDPQAWTVTRSLCLRMGEYFQIQDDYLDCFGDPAVIGKIGTDIQDNKCSWLVVQALQRSTPEQKTLLKDNYGQWDDGKVTVVKELYHTLDLPAVFAAYEEESYQSIQADLAQCTVIPRAVFDVFLQKIYKRSK